MRISLRICVCLFISVISLNGYAQLHVTVNEQKAFGKNIPAGNYSGITRIKDNLYALVSDKSDRDGYFIFKIDVDSINGDILNIENKGFIASNVPNRDAEGIAYIPKRKTVLIVGESDDRIMEYDSVGTFTGRELSLEAASKNYGYESLSYNENTNLLWTCTENMYSNADEMLATDSAAVVTLQAYNTDLRLDSKYLYRLDRPLADNKGKYYAHGVSELLALDDCSLIVLEREFRVPKNILGSYVVCKLYRVFPQKSLLKKQQNTISLEVLPKDMLCEWTTRLTILNHSLANYEGMCLGPKLSDGSQVIIMVSDSQNREGGILRDWFRTVVIKSNDIE